MQKPLFAIFGVGFVLWYRYVEASVANLPSRQQKIEFELEGGSALGLATHGMVEAIEAEVMGFRVGIFNVRSWTLE